MKTNQKAQSIVEFALIIPLIILVITVFIDLSRGFFYSTTLSNAVREGARYAVVHHVNTEEEKQEVVDIVVHFAIALDPENIIVTITEPDAENAYVTVNGTYFFQPVTPGLSLILGDTPGIQLESQSIMQIAPLVKESD